jgi:hypothetical protein
VRKPKTAVCGIARAREPQQQLLSSINNNFAGVILGDSRSCFSFAWTLFFTESVPIHHYTSCKAVDKQMIIRNGYSAVSQPIKTRNPTRECLLLIPFEIVTFSRL